ncbi:MAG: PEP-CTERM sorting domain-containing protein [Planctomycetota bacterium]|jgi:hypothetical protein
MRVLSFAAIAACVLVLAAPNAQADSIQIGLNFTGSTMGEQETDGSYWFPPDTMGGVGEDHIVEILNGAYRVYDKTDGSVLQESTLNDFWTSSGVSWNSKTFDPRVLYDAASDRWYAASVDGSRQANSILFAISDSGDPTAGWTGYSFDSDSTDERWADFPTMGLNADGIFISATMFPTTTSAETDALKFVLTIPKADLIGGSVANVTTFENISDSIGFNQQPVVNYDGGEMPQLLLTAYNVPDGWLKFNTIEGPIDSPTLDTAGGFVSITPLDDPLEAQQQGTTDLVNTGDTRISGNAVLVDGEIWAVHSYDEGGRAGIAWYRIDADTLNIIESGTISDPDLAYYYPSIAVNRYGEVVIGFSGSGSDQYISAYAAVGWMSGGVTTFKDPMLLHAGSASYTILDSSDRNRWGDYSATVFDPFDERTFWTFQEFVSDTNEWSIRITQIRFGIAEPATALLLAVGTGLLLLRRRRRSRASGA